MSQSDDVKPIITVDGHDVFNIPVVEDEEELEVSPTLADSKVWAIKVREGRRRLQALIARGD